MNNDPIKIAKSKIAFHEQEIVKLRQFLEMAESLLQSEAASGRLTKAEDNAVAKKETATDSLQNISPSGELKASSRSAILKESEDYLRQKGRPVPASEIYDVITRRGIRISGQNPRGNLTAKFATAKDRFLYDKETGHWSLSEWLLEDYEDLLGDDKK